MKTEEGLHRTEEHEFNCIQTEKTQEIHESQQVMQEHQESIKQTLDIMKDRLTNIFQLYQKQDKRLDDGDKRFQEIRDFMIKKEATNGHIEKEIDDNTQDIEKGHDNRLGIEVRVTTLEVSMLSLTKNLDTIISILKALSIAFISFFIIFMVKTVIMGI